MSNSPYSGKVQETSINKAALLDLELKSLIPGMQLCGKLRLESEAGRGAMGIVWKAYDLTMSQYVAIRFLPPEIRHQESAMQQLRIKAQTIRTLNHQFICPVYGIEEDSKFGCMMVMQWLDGLTLKQLCQEKRKFRIPVEPEVITGVLCNVGEALDYAHKHGVIHKDLKPSNVFLRYKGATFEEASLIDFGMTVEIQESLIHNSNAKEQDTETFMYMTPEQWLNEPETAQTDQYALAMIAYELYANHPPFQATDPKALRSCVLLNNPSEIEGISASMNATIMKALSKNPADRFASCMEFVEALRSSDTKISFGPTSQVSEQSVQTNCLPGISSTEVNSGKSSETQEFAVPGSFTQQANSGTLDFAASNSSSSVPSSQIQSRKKAAGASVFSFAKGVFGDKKKHTPTKKSTPTSENPVVQEKVSEPFSFSAAPAPEANVPTFELPAAPAPEVKAPTFELPPTPAPEAKAPTFELPPTPAPEAKAPTFELPPTPAPEVKAPTFELPPTPASEAKAPTFELPPTPAPEAKAPTFELPPAPEAKAPTSEFPPVPVSGGKISSFERPVTPSFQFPSIATAEATHSTVQVPPVTPENLAVPKVPLQEEIPTQATNGFYTSGETPTVNSSLELMVKQSSIKGRAANTFSGTKAESPAAKSKRKNASSKSASQVPSQNLLLWGGIGVLVAAGGFLLMKQNTSQVEIINVAPAVVKEENDFSQIQQSEWSTPTVQEEVQNDSVIVPFDPGVIYDCLKNRDLDQAKHALALVNEQIHSPEDQQKLQRLVTAFDCYETFYKTVLWDLSHFSPPKELCNGDYIVVECAKDAILIRCQGKNVRFTLKEPNAGGANLFEILYRHHSLTAEERGNLVPMLTYATFLLFTEPNEKTKAAEMLERVLQNGTPKDRQIAQDVKTLFGL